MLLLLLSLFANGDTTYHWRVPRGFPPIPSSYSDWGDYSFYQVADGRNWDWSMWNKHFGTFYGASVPSLNDTSLFPFTISLAGFKDIIPYGDSLFGVINYETDTSRWYCDPDSVEPRTKSVSAYWFPRQEVDLDTQRITQNLWPTGVADITYPQSMAVDSHFDVVKIGEITGYRHRGRWRDSQCDESYQATGSFTVYFIPAEKFDYHIICRTLIYSCDVHPWEGYEYPPEVRDTLPRFIIKNYPDQITELERAVEETFKIKE